MKELTLNESKTVNGGVVSLAIGVVGGLIGIYSLGKAIGKAWAQSMENDQ